VFEPICKEHLYPFTTDSPHGKVDRGPRDPHPKVVDATHQTPVVRALDAVPVQDF